MHHVFQGKSSLSSSKKAMFTQALHWIRRHSGDRWFDLSKVCCFKSNLFRLAVLVVKYTWELVTCGYYIPGLLGSIWMHFLEKTPSQIGTCCGGAFLSFSSGLPSESDKTQIILWSTMVHHFKSFLKWQYKEMDSLRYRLSNWCINPFKWFQVQIYRRSTKKPAVRRLPTSFPIVLDLFPHPRPELRENARYRTEKCGIPVSNISENIDRSPFQGPK